MDPIYLLTACGVSHTDPKTGLVMSQPAPVNVILLICLTFEGLLFSIFAVIMAIVQFQVRRYLDEIDTKLTSSFLFLISGHLERRDGHRAAEEGDRKAEKPPPDEVAEGGLWPEGLQPRLVLPLHQGRVGGVRPVELHCLVWRRQQQQQQQLIPFFPVFPV